ncbi:MAG: hypothetical protein K9K66_04435 [Desulfarculaceae bacterium]|nr:hypothetical protein [Desulfarculaceae bacterium]MCF8073291.1 hypothetical protein [Desulfarculaceae bacterium]MCF8100887.1 hypothetical protein [Desulfarculaceae bacterium]MCF8116657.1 hypothetical protein [Desulfarculaceae bacterium]
MATLEDGCYTLRDWVMDYLGPDGKTLLPIVRMMERLNPIIDDIMWIESNMVDGNKILIETGLPTTVLRALYEGVMSSKGNLIQVTDKMGKFHNVMEVDKELAELNGMKPEFFLRRSRGYITSITNDMVDHIYYGDRSTHPKGFDGLAKRFPFKDSPNVIDAGGDGNDLTSIWFVCWGPDSLYGIFPKGTKAGLVQTEPKEVEIVDTVNGGTFEGYRKRFKWDGGITLEDWRQVVRICNIETAGAVNIFDYKHTVTALYTMDNPDRGKAVWYVNRAMAAQMHQAALDKSNAALTLDQAAEGGKKVVHLHGYPVRICDAILKTEAELTAAP